MEQLSNIDKAIRVLHVTNDGNDLSPVELKLTELAVNGFLSAEGQEAFDALFARVTAPKPKTYEVAVYRTVQDVLRTFIKVEATSDEEALEKAHDAFDNGTEGDDYSPFAFWQCGDSVGEDTFEVFGVTE